MSIEQLQRDVKEIVSSLNVLLAERGYKQIGQPLTDEHSPEVVRPQWEAIPQEEKDAGWWGLESAFWSFGEKFAPTDDPTWGARYRYRIVKTAAHPDNDRHARVKLEWQRVKDAGTHELWVQHAHDHDSQWRVAPTTTAFCSNNDYEIRPIAKKKIDLSRLPIGAMTNYGRINAFFGNPRKAHCYGGVANGWRSVHVSELRIAPMSQWEVLQEGDVIPEGLLYESDCFYKNAIVVYRITGIKDGWTDE